MTFLGRFTGNVPRVIGRPWVGGVDRELWNWMRKIHDSVSTTTSQLTQIFSTPGGALQGLLTTKGDLLGFDTQPARVPAGANGNVLAADSTTALGLAYQAQIAALMLKCKSGWRMEEATGLNRQDSIGREGFQDLVPYDTPTLAAGKIGGAVESPGGHGLYVRDDGFDGPLNPKTGNFTISAWVYPTSFAKTIYIVCKGAISSAPYHIGYNFLITTTPVLFAVIGGPLSGTRGGQYATNAVPTLNAWNHCVMVVDRTDTGLFYVYLNNVLAKPASAGDSAEVDHWADSSGDISTDAPFATLLRTISPSASGSSGIHGPTTDWGPARIDALHYFDWALSREEVSLLYFSGLGRELSPLWAERLGDPVADPFLLALH